MPRALRAIGTKKPVQTGQMRKKGVEPIHPNREQEPESCASTNFATFAYEKQCKTTATTNRRRHALYSRTPPYASFFCLSALFAAFLGRSMSLSLHTSFFWGARALCRYRSIRARGAAEAAVAVVKNCCECDEWPLQSSSMDDCMTNAKKSSKEPPVVRVPSCTYSHALHIQSQAPSSLRRPSPVLTTK